MESEVHKCALAARAHGVIAAVGQPRRFGGAGALAVSGFVEAQRIGGDVLDIRAFDLSHGAAKITVDEFRRKPDRLEYLRAAIRLKSRHAHLRHDFQNAFADRGAVVIDPLLRRQIGIQSEQRAVGEIRIHRLGAEAREHGEIVHFARRPGFGDKPDGGAATGLD